jgi:hypothetical protein
VEEARDQPKNTAVNAEYPLRSNDETLDDEAHRRSRCSRRGQGQPSATPMLSTSLSTSPHYAPLHTEEITAAIVVGSRVRA